MRRAYEHLGVVQVLHGSLEPHAAAEIGSLMKLAQQELTAGHTQAGADLLRAAEHPSFGALSSPDKDPHVDPNLLESITREFDHKLRKAEEHWAAGAQMHDLVGQSFDAARAGAQRAFGAGAYRQALELARAAEAVAHVRLGIPTARVPGRRRSRVTDWTRCPGPIPRERREETSPAKDSSGNASAVRDPEDACARPRIPHA